ncbi:MAG: hypothetical protein RLZZ383_1916 [Pseudomonadota bacterium]|jgi:YidC/Oxa1 family membrane protein insertase
MSKAGGKLIRPGGDTSDSRASLAILAIAGVWFAWLQLNPPKTDVDASNGGEGASGAVASMAPDPAGGAGPSAPSAGGAVPAIPNVDLAVPLCGATGTFSTSTGRLHGVVVEGATQPYEVTPLWRWLLQGAQGSWSPWGEEPAAVSLLGDAGSLGVGLGDGASGSLPTPVGGYQAVRQSDDLLEVQATTATGLQVTQTFTRARDAQGVCSSSLAVVWANAGSEALPGVHVGIVDTLGPVGDVPGLAIRPTLGVDADVESLIDLSELDEAPVSARPGRIDFLGLSNTYFALLLVPQTPGGRGAFVADGAAGRGALWSSPDVLAPGDAREATFSLYAGDKRRSSLGAVDDRLLAAVDLGFFSFFAVPLLAVLGWLHGVIGDWALSIIALTFLVKAAFFRLTASSMRSSQAMQEVQPELEKLRREHADNPEELNRRTMALFQERGVNPLGGCLPMFAQMPVWIALYTMLSTTVDLYHASFLYLRDLTVPDPYMVLPTVVTALMLGQQRLNPPPPNMDASQAMMLRWMPLMFGLFFYTLPSGLVLYIFVNTLLGILQQATLKATIKPKPTQPA